MKPTQTLLLGLAGLGFVLALPAQAATDRSESLMTALNEGSFVLAKRDDGEGRAEPRRDQRDEPRAKNIKRFPTRDAERAYPQDYGYGYERRQQQAPSRDEENRNRH